MTIVESSIIILLFFRLLGAIAHTETPSTDLALRKNNEHTIMHSNKPKKN